MQLLQAQREALRHRQHHLGEQRGAVGIEQPIQRAADAVVAQARSLRGIDAEQAGGETGGRLLLAVHRLAFHHDRAQQHAQRLRVGQHAAPIGGGHMPLKQLHQAHASDKVVDQGQGSQALGVHTEVGGAKRLKRHLTYAILSVRQ